ncbi:transposase, partial [Burkholderia cenocepacia]
MILVYRYRVKYFCNDTQKHALKWSKKWPTGFDLNVLTTGSSKELG